MRFFLLLAILGCQPTFSSPDANQDTTITWVSGCIDYGCTISKVRSLNGIISLKIKWCCPFLDKATGSVLIRNKPGDAWVSTVVEYQCGATAVFDVSPLLTSIEASMQTTSRPEVADKCK